MFIFYYSHFFICSVILVCGGESVYVSMDRCSCGCMCVHVRVCRSQPQILFVWYFLPWGFVCLFRFFVCSFVETRALISLELIE